MFSRIAKVFRIQMVWGFLIYRLTVDGLVKPVQIVHLVRVYADYAIVEFNVMLWAQH